MQYISQAISLADGVVGSLSTDYLPCATKQLAELTQSHTEADFYIIVRNHTTQAQQPLTDDLTTQAPKLSFSRQFYADNDDSYALTGLELNGLDEDSEVHHDH